MPIDSNENLENVSPMDEIGSTGIQQFSGQISEEFLDDLKGREKLLTYKEMSHNDPVVSAILYSIDQLMKHTDWNVRPASSDRKDLETADFLRQCMQDMEHGWKRMIGQVNQRHVYGFSPMEQVYKRRDGDNSDFDDERIGWDKIEIRRPDTLWKWIYDEDETTLEGMRQQNPTTFEYHDIPLEKLLVFTVQGEGGSPEGKSLLRGAYRPWKFKKKIEEIEAIGIERGLAGLPVIGMPPEFFSKDADKDQVSIRNKMKDMVQKVRRNESEGIVMPREFNEEGEKRFELRLLQSGGDRQIDPSDTVRRYRQAIATSLLSDFLLLGQSDQVGSFALSRDKTSLFSMGVESLLDDIQQKFNNKAVPQLFGLNDFAVDELPRIEHDEVRQEDVTDIASTLKDLASAGAQPFANDDQNELLNSILKQMNQPTVEEQQAPRSLETGDPGQVTGQEQQQEQDEQPDRQTRDLTQLDEEKDYQPLEKQFSVGDWVQWNSAGGTAYGKVDEVVRDGCTSRGKGSVEVCADENDPAVVVEVYDDETGESQDELVRHKMSTLNEWSGPMEKAVNPPEFDDGTMVHWQVNPDMQGRVVHNPDDEDIVMVEVMDNGEPTGHTLTASPADLIPMEQSMRKQVDTVPTQEISDNASQALEKYNDDELDNDECGTRVGVERANQLENQEELSEDTINRMVSFFSRHEGDEEINEGVDNKWEDCGYLTWQFWGGDAGFDWAKRKQEQFESDDS